MKKTASTLIIDPSHYGVSFSIKQCRNFRLDAHETLQWLIEQGWRRFRLMSYWNEHENKRGVYDFSELDWQIDMIARAGGVVTLCLGVKQPRWPEYHWPQWSHNLTEPQKTAALLAFVEKTVQRYKGNPAIISYQLENEALLKGFGDNIHISRSRLRREYQLVRRLDPERPVYMSTSNGWGVPLRRPLPWGVGFSVYTTMYKKGAYRKTVQRPWLHRWRAWFIRNFLARPVFIHELQCEPWGPKNIWDMTVSEQDKSMSPERIRHNIAWAKHIGAMPIDIWGAEWWYWGHIQGDDTICKSVIEEL